MNLFFFLIPTFNAEFVGNGALLFFLFVFDEVILIS
jgi:hypothetical protein